MPQVAQIDVPPQELGIESKMQTNERRDMVAKVLSRFYDMREIRNQPQPFFRNRTLLEYIQDGLERVNQYKERPSWKKWWQANVSGPTTRNKLVSLLSKLANNAMESRVEAVNETDFLSKLKERVTNALLRAAGIKNKDDRALVLEMFEGAAKGTVAGYEGWLVDQRMTREVLDIDPKTGDVKYKEKEVKLWNDVFGCLVPLEDMFFGDLFVSDIQEMDDCAWRQVMKFDKFRNEFGDYEDADLVQPLKSPVGYSGGEENATIFYQPSDDIAEDEVELLRYYNQATDEFMLLASGIWINPMGAAKVAPLPFNHKKLPFWVGKFEILDAKFIYGKSLPDKMIATQDTRDKILENILDKLTMALRAPLVVKGVSASLAEGYFEPDHIIEVESPTGNESVEQLKFAEPGSASFQVLEALDRELTSTSPDVQGQAKSSKTATEVSIERESALEMVSLFLRLMEFAIRDKYLLRLSNILQFYTFPSHQKDKEGRFKRVILRNETLSTGEVGTLDLSFTDDINQRKLEQESRMSLEPMEKIQITPEFIREFEADVVMRPRSSVKQSEALRQAQEVNFQKVVTALYPDMFNRETGFLDLVSKYPDKDPYRLRKTQKPSGMEGVMGMDTLGGGAELPEKEPSLREMAG